MRRFIFSVLIVTLLAPAAFTTSRPSLDGRAVVAGEGVLPAGLFAKTVGYLPGDSVSVTNPATGITISVLILGSIDPSAGVAILLSPEAADKLFITPESNTQVRITKRTGMLDESVSGTGTVISDTPTDSFLPNRTKDNLDSRLEAVDETLGTAPAVDSTSADTPPVEDIAEELASTPVAEPAEENAADLVLVPDTSSTEPAAESTTNEELEHGYDITSVEEVPLNHVLAEHDPVYIVESVEDTVEPIPLPSPPESIEAPTIAEIVETNHDAEEEATPQPPAPEITSSEKTGESSSEKTEESGPVEEAIVLVPVERSTPEVVSSPVEETVLADKADSNLADPFSPIILVPADENPPLEAESTFTPTPVSPAASVAKNVPPTSGGSLGTDSRIQTKHLSELERGKYYVQIATLEEQENIDKLLKEYGGKYPLVMVPLKSGKAMQMMVGPLNVDEYGAILAKFKSLGFKDSFLRKIR